MKVITLLSMIFVLMSVQAQEIFVDERDKNEYKTITIGEQQWLAENLRFLPNVMPPNKNSIKKEMYYVLNHESSDVDVVKQSKAYKETGVLYNHQAALKACPAEWHLPSNKDWGELAEFIINENGGAEKGYKMAMGSVSGSYHLLAIKLKSVEYWSDKNGTNDYGFNGIPTGYYYSNAPSFNTSKGSYWWAQDSELDVAYYRSLFNSHDKFTASRMRKSYGLSVRCIKNDEDYSSSINNTKAKGEKKEYCEFVNPSDPNETLRVICEDDDLGGESWEDIKKLTKKWGGRCYKK